MATLDTTLLIQSAVTPASTTAKQSKPAEGFQQLLDDESYKASNPARQPKPAVVDSRPVREASHPKGLQPGARRSNETKAQPDSNVARPALKQPEAGAGKGRSEAPAKVAQRTAAAHSSQREETEGLTEVEAESTQQDLPSEMAGEGSEPSELGPPKESVAEAVASEAPAPVAQTASAVALLASLLVQTTADLKGTQVAVESEPQVSEPLSATELPTLPASALAGAPSTGTAAWMSSATPISPEVFASSAPVGDASVAVTDPVAVLLEPASLAQPETTISSDSASATVAKEITSKSLVSEIRNSESAAVVTTGQEAATAQVEPMPQKTVQSTSAQAEPLAGAGKPAAAATPAIAEKAQKLSKSGQELARKEELPELEVHAELLSSQSLSQQGAETAGATPQKDPSHSNQQQAEPEDSENVHNLKSAIISNREIPRAQSVDHEVWEAKRNVTHQVPELASVAESQGIAARASREVASNTVTATETSSPIVTIPEPTSLPEATGKVASTFHANVNWGQVEKAQVVSQIVERAHLLGKNQSELIVVLKPEFLGKVNLHAAMVDNQLVATIMAESASVRQMLETQLSSLQNALHEQGLPVAKVEIVQGSQLSFADMGAGQSSSQQHLESSKSQLHPSLSLYQTREESAELVPQEARIYAPPTSRSLNLVA